MPRRTIDFIKGNYYHIYNQGAVRQSIFREERNYLYLKRLMARVATDCKLTVIAYCLLPNHYHWLVRQDGDTPAGALPQRVFGSYSQAFNRAYRGRGTLFQGPYCARMIDTDGYLRHLCRYIHGNPVKHGIVTSIDAWPHSNYLDWIGVRSGVFVDRQFIADYFETAERYAAFIHEYVKTLGGAGERLGQFEDE